jgi:hypothetical protein
MRPGTLSASHPDAGADYRRELTDARRVDRADRGETTVPDDGPPARRQPRRQPLSIVRDEKACFQELYTCSLIGKTADFIHMGRSPQTALVRQAAPVPRRTCGARSNHRS